MPVLDCADRLIRGPIPPEVGYRWRWRDDRLLNEKEALEQVTVLDRVDLLSWLHPLRKPDRINLLRWIKWNWLGKARILYLIPDVTH